MYLTVWQPLLECIFRQIARSQDNIPIIISIFLINSD